MKARILVVEDESIVQLDIQYRLEKMGHEVVGFASRGEDAVAKASDLKPDLVIMDVRLDGSMNGLEAAQKIGAGPGTPVVYITAYPEIHTAEQHKALGPRLSKPFTNAEFHAVITRALTDRP